MAEANGWLERWVWKGIPIIFVSWTDDGEPGNDGEEHRILETDIAVVEQDEWIVRMQGGDEGDTHGYRDGSIMVFQRQAINARRGFNGRYRCLKSIPLFQTSPWPPKSQIVDSGAIGWRFQTS